MYKFSVVGEERGPSRQDVSERRKLANIRNGIRVLLTFRSLGKRQLLAAGYARSRQKPPCRPMFRNETKIDSCTSPSTLLCEKCSRQHRDLV